MQCVAAGFPGPGWRVLTGEAAGRPLRTGPDPREAGGEFPHGVGGVTFRSLRSRSGLELI